MYILLSIILILFHFIIQISSYGYLQLSICPETPESMSYE